MKVRDIKVGTTVRFVPAAWLEKNTAQPSKSFGNLPVEVVGTITYVNKAHRWFRATYKAGRFTASEGFKF